jgi:hypothetical protein
LASLWDEMLTKGGKRMTRKVAILLAVMGLMVMAFAGVALAVRRPEMRDRTGW